MQAFHRDLDDCRSLTIFTLLTPVDVPEEGVHFYVEKSHEPALLEESLRADGVGTKIDYLLTGPFVAPMAMRLFNRSARRFHGPAGSSLCADAYGLHRFVVPRSRPKLLLELRFGTFFNEHVYDMKLDRDATRADCSDKSLAPRCAIGGYSTRPASSRCAAPCGEFRRRRATSMFSAT